jgi:hypothetical protein
VTNSAPTQIVVKLGECGCRPHHVCHQSPRQASRDKQRSGASSITRQRSAWPKGVAPYKASGLVLAHGQPRTGCTGFVL